MNTDEIRAALRRKFPAGEYAMLEEVRDAAGFGASRSADALVMSLWPSRGLELWGVEIKACRSDWVRELKNPKKAEAIAAYCDRWFIAAGDSTMVRDDELPLGWGLMCPVGDQFKTVKNGVLLEPKPLTRTFVAAMFRRAQETGATAEQVRAAIRSADAEARAQERSQRSSRERAYVDLEARVAAFEKASGVDIGAGWHSPEKIGAAVRTVLDGKHLRGLNEMRRMETRMEMVLRELREAIAEAEPRPVLTEVEA